MALEPIIPGMGGPEIRYNLDQLALAALGRPIFDWDFSKLTVADGSPVVIVPDMSGNGGHVYQVTSALQPVKQTDTASGLAVGRFNGSTHRMRADTFGNAEPATAGAVTPMTIALVVKPQIPASQPNTTPAIINGTGTNAPLISILNGAGVNTGQVYVGGNALSNNSGQFNPTIMDDNWHIVVVTGNSAVATIYLDGYYVSTITGDIFATALSRPYIAANNGNAQHFAGDIGQIMGFASRLTAIEVKKLTETLAQKWAIDLTLYAAPDATNYSEDVATSDTSDCRIWTPARPASVPTLVLWCHPQAADRNITPSYFAYPYVRASLAQGWYVAVSNMGFTGSPGGSASSWGNATAQNALLLLYNQMVTRIGSTPRVILIGASMGGCAAALAVIKETIPVNAVYFIDAALSLFDMYKTSYYSSIDAGYGCVAGTLSAAASAGASTVSSSVSYSAGTIVALSTGLSGVELATVQSVSGAGPYTLTLTAPLANNHSSGARISDYGTKTAGNDPMLAATTQFAGLPIRYNASNADTLVAIGPHTTAFAAKMAGIATGNTVKLHLGGHLAAGATDPRDFMEFVQANLT